MWDAGKARGNQGCCEVARAVIKQLPFPPDTVTETPPYFKLRRAALWMAWPLLHHYPRPGPVNSLSPGWAVGGLGGRRESGDRLTESPARATAS